jgi:hypothetical protein
MIALICFAVAVLASSFRSKSRLEAENAVVCTENAIRVYRGQNCLSWWNDWPAQFILFSLGLTVQVEVAA